MGVPSFFRWLSMKYPKIIAPALEDPAQVVDGVTLPIDYAAPNPNGELDNLYLDMNGIVHPCSHPEDRPAPETEDEMLLAVFEYTNRVLNIARPRKVLVMAVDGVAPRAKMNQQRARRFRSVRDAAIANEEREREIHERESRGEVIDEAVKSKKTWDSNAITPGTPFMDKLALSLRYWTAFKLSTDPGWKDLQVIISDATVPGEGEHKIMNFIRSQRADPQYNPNTTHCIYGLDADLIFLGLATHEPHFKILREDVFEQSVNRGGNRYGGNNNNNNGNQSRFAPQSEEDKQMQQQEAAQKPFLWLHVSVLREYLSAELWVPRLPFNFDLERAIDDWVFMCFFCGNDFLPHLPCLDVRENSIDILLDIWKVMLPKLKTYLTCDGNLNLGSVERILRELGAREPDIFKTRYEHEARKQEAMARKKARHNENRKRNRAKKAGTLTEQLQLHDTDGNLASGSWNLTTHDMVKLKKEIMLANEGDPKAIAIVKAQSDKNNELMKSITEEEMDKVVAQANISNRSTAEVMKKRLMAKKHALEESEEEEKKEEEEGGVVPKKPKTEQDNLNNQIKSEVEAEDENDDDEEEENEDDEDDEDEDNDTESGSATPSDFKEAATEMVSNGHITSGIFDSSVATKLHEPGYSERYYQEKFHVEAKDMDTVRKGVVKAYIEGVAWVLRYYYQGCASWTWYYPFHYAPFAADFTDIADLDIQFDEGIPFLPFEQLMSVLPAASGHTLPPIFRPLMSDADSPIIDFYPVEFPIDMDGKKRAWQGISLLPFIDEKRLLEVVRAQYPKLSDYDRSRNIRGEDVLLISNKNANYDMFLQKLYSGEETNIKPIKFGHFKSGLSGIVSIDTEGFQINGKLTCPLEEGSLPELSTNLFLKMGFEFNPLIVPNKSVILNGYTPPIQTLDNYDMDSIMQKWNSGRGGRGFYGNMGSRFNDTMRTNVVKTGPSGTTQYKPRAGGYRAFFYFGQFRNNNQQNHNRNYNNRDAGNQYYNRDGNNSRNYNGNNRGNYRNNNYQRRDQSNYNANNGRGGYNNGNGFNNNRQGNYGQNNRNGGQRRY